MKKKTDWATPARKLAASKTIEKSKNPWVICNDCGHRFPDTVEDKAFHIYQEHPMHFFQSMLKLLPRMQQLSSQLTVNIRSSIEKNTR